jgi:hypothetical protein
MEPTSTLIKHKHYDKTPRKRKEIQPNLVGVLHPNNNNVSMDLDIHRYPAHQKRAQKAIFPMDFMGWVLKK